MFNNLLSGENSLLISFFLICTLTWTHTTKLQYICKTYDNPVPLLMWPELSPSSFFSYTPTSALSFPFIQVPLAHCCYSWLWTGWSLDHTGLCAANQSRTKLFVQPPSPPLAVAHPPVCAPWKSLSQMCTIAIQRTCHVFISYTLVLTRTSGDTLMPY